MHEKGGVVALEENVEGFATPKHLVKEDGTQATKGETLPFKVIEFNKDSKRIILSHSRTFEDPAREEKKAAAAAAKKASRAKKEDSPEEKKAAAAAAKKASRAKKEDSPKIENIAASTTLGDIDALAELKAKLEKGEKK